ncbi:hypothetical protein AVEN_186314-1, partial [Araneus ventricosus]
MWQNSDSCLCEVYRRSTLHTPAHVLGGLVVRSQLLGRRVPDLKPDSAEDPSCIVPVACQVTRSGSNVLPL